MYEENFLDELPVSIHSDNFDTTQVQEVVLNNHVLNSLTPLTLSDGTQAFIAESIIENGNHFLINIS